MNVIDGKTPWEDRAYYFCGNLAPPLVARVWHFRSEERYDAETQAKTVAMQLIRRAIECVERRPYLLLTSGVETESASRSRKGVLWDEGDLQLLPHLLFEVSCENGGSRLGAIVDLSQFGFDGASNAILNWGRALIVLSSEPIKSLPHLTEHWLSTDPRDVLAFDYDAVAASLREHRTTGILRYLPPSSSRPEGLVVVGDKNFVSQRVGECIESIM